MVPQSLPRAEELAALWLALLRQVALHRTAFSVLCGVHILRGVWRF